MANKITRDGFREVMRSLDAAAAAAILTYVDKLDWWQDTDADDQASHYEVAVGELDMYVENDAANLICVAATATGLDVDDLSDYLRRESSAWLRANLGTGAER